jgi:hypothetical protein
MNNSDSKLSFVDAQNEYATIIRRLGDAVIDGEKKLSEYLDVGGIPFWDIFAAELACRHMTTALSSTDIIARTRQQIKPYLLRLRQKVNVKKSLLNTNGCDTWPESQTLLFLGFTERHYTEVLEPVVAKILKNTDCNVVIMSEKRDLNPEYFLMADV